MSSSVRAGGELPSMSSTPNSWPTAAAMSTWPVRAGRFGSWKSALITRPMNSGLSLNPVGVMRARAESAVQVGFKISLMSDDTLESLTVRVLEQDAELLNE